MTSIIRNQTIMLGNQFESIKDTIKSKEQFINLASISSFDTSKKSITFKTEKIHPIKTKNAQTPVLLLFSNPHPVSVASGMFLSEPHSRSFWNRLFACESMYSNDVLLRSISNWNDETIEILAHNLLYQDCSDKISLYFDCLESLPTNQYNDLKKLFPKNVGKELRRTSLQIPGMENLSNLSTKCSIKSWIVFSAEAFRYICQDKTLAKYAPDRIISALDNNVADQDDQELWSDLCDLKRKVIINDIEITVYLSLIARRKNWRNKTGKHYFTVMLDKIITQILRQEKNI